MPLDEYPAAGQQQHAEPYASGMADVDAAAVAAEPQYQAEYSDYEPQPAYEQQQPSGYAADPYATNPQQQYPTDSQAYPVEQQQYDDGGGQHYDQPPVDAYSASIAQPSYDAQFEGQPTGYAEPQQQYDTDYAPTATATATAATAAAAVDYTQQAANQQQQPRSSTTSPTAVTATGPPAGRPQPVASDTNVGPEFARSGADGVQSQQRAMQQQPAATAAVPQ